MNGFRLTLHNYRLVVLYTLFCFFLNPFKGLSQSDNKYRIRYLSMKDGMSQVSVNDLIKDNNGFVWVATADGLNKYDGNIFKHYKNNPQDSTSISGNFITKLVQGTDGTIWVGTNGDGLNAYNLNSDSFKKIKLAKQNQPETITGIISLEDGSLKVSSVNEGLYDLKLNPNGSFTKTLLLKEQITSLYLNESNQLWVGGLHGEVYGFLKSDIKPFVEFKVKGNVQSFFSYKNYLLIGTYEGFFIYDLTSKTYKSFELEASGSFKTMHVLDFMPHDKNHVWIATGRGLYLFNLHDFKVVDKIEYTDKSGEGLSNNTVQALLRLSNDQFFVGTANGLNCFKLSQPYFKNISKDKKGENLLNDNVIFSVYKDKDLWIGTSDGGLNLIKDGRSYYYIDDKNDSTTIAGSVIRSIAHDKENKRMWFATTRGLSMLDLQDFNADKPIFTNFYYQPNNPNSINSNFLKDLVLDKNNNLWGATHEHGVFKLEYKGNRNYDIERFTSKSEENSLVNNEVNCLEIDNEGNIWAGTQHGISKIDYSNDYEEMQFYNFKKDEYNTLSHDAVNDILVDDENRIWIGTRDGLNLLNNENQFVSWTKQKEFPNTLIYSIQNDLKGNLWIGTNDGIVQFNTSNETFAHYDVVDNIQGKEFDLHARFRDHDGNIYLGGIDGLTYFNPNNLSVIDEPKSLYFSELRIKDSIIRPSKIKADGVLSKAIQNTKSLNFKHNQFPFYLNFSSIDYRFNKNVKYAYKLLPVDKEWNFLNDNEIQFLNLPSGDYQLLVNGFSRGNEWESQPLQMAIVIKSPWWSTNLAYLCYIIGMITLIYFGYKFQLTRKLAIQESKKLKEIDSLKNSLYTNITHEFRTPITVILGMVDNLRSKLKPVNNNANNSLLLIEKNSKELLQMVNNMLDLAKLEAAELKLNMQQSDIVGFVRYIFESFESLADKKDIKYTFYSEIESLVMDFDSDKFSTAITNLIVNAIKFTPNGGKIICHVKKESNNNLLIKIIDTGIGVSEEDIENIFKKFYQSKFSISRQFGGTGIGLALTKELVELMGGAIHVKSTEQKGSEFAICLPINNTAKVIEPLKENLIDKKEKHSSSGLVEPEPDFNLVDEQLPIALIIEDNKDVAFYLKSCLEDQYKTIYAKDGEEGINMAFKYVPDIIISDVMMPKKNGYEVCERLKTEMITDHIPIILLTAKATDKDRIEGLSYGADAYLVKPFNKEELFTRIDHLVSLRKKMIAKFSNEDYKEFTARKDNNPETLFIKKIISAVEEELDNPDFGATQLALKLHLSESQVYRKIKATTNRSTAIFIRSIRLNKAKQFLQTGDRTISQVAFDVGFSSPSWFSRAFKEEFGYSPSEST